MSTVLERLLQDHKRIGKVFAVLEQEVSAWTEGQTPDIVLIESCLSYCINYCDLAHHAREDLMFERMLETDRAATEKVAESLKTLHIVLTDRIRPLQRAVQEAVSGPPEKAQSVKALTADFL